MERNRQNFSHFGPFFAPLHPSPTPSPPSNPENQNSEKMKIHLEISSFYRSAAKIMIKCYTVPEIWHMMDVIIFHSGLFFAFLCY